MTKEQQFIAIVQTAFLANAVNISLDPDARDRRHLLSATASLIFMREAVRASERIPAGMDVSDAADEFVGWMVENLRAEGDHVPAWFARG